MSRCGWSTDLKQQESFPVCIGNVVREYGGGTAVFKELLANADDARATQVTICLDKSQYGESGLFSDGMASLQGAAVMIYNHATFSTDNWQNYTKNVGRSAKANDSNTIGKFGKGALTAYSITDVIQIVSDSHILILDPHTTHLQVADQSNSIFGNIVDANDYNYVDIARDCPGQLEPFVSFTKDCPDTPSLQIAEPYQGSLFRLALRTKTAAISSEISSDSFTPEHIMKDLDTFIKSAPDLLLFTRNVKSMSVWIKETADSPSSLLHRCSASVTHMPNSLNSCILQQIEINTQNGLQHGEASKMVWIKALHLPKDVTLCGGDVAALLLKEGSDQILPAVDGKVYSTLALPFEETKLPVHINGAFNMSFDRRTLRTGEGDRGEVSFV